MNNAVWAMLNETEKGLLRDAEPSTLAGLDEDGLGELHDRIRRARNKYSKLYRRRAGAQVKADSTRAGAHAQHARTVAKAEAFEDALARVSRALAKSAKASADELKAERLAAARAVRGVPASRSTKTAGGSRVGAAGGKAKRRTPISKKASATSRATTKRSQAARDGR